jgi:hypothetical protein
MLGVIDLGAAANVLAQAGVDGNEGLIKAGGDRWAQDPLERRPAAVELTPKPLGKVSSDDPTAMATEPPRPQPGTIRLRASRSRFTVS